MYLSANTYKDSSQFMLINCRSPGFGLTLVAETLNGSFLSAEISSTPQGQGDPVLPEDLGRNCAKLLLEEIHRVRTVKTTQTFMRLGSYQFWVFDKKCKMCKMRLLCAVYTGFLLQLV